MNVSILLTFVILWPITYNILYKGEGEEWQLVRRIYINEILFCN